MNKLTSISQLNFFVIIKMMKFFINLLAISIAQANVAVEMINMLYPDTLVPKGQEEESISSDLLKNFDFNYTFITPVDDLGDIGV